MKAGFVFVPLTYNYLLGDWNRMKPELKVFFNHGLPTAERKEIVLLSHVLQTDVNSGYQYFNNIIVDKVNGKRIGSMRDLVESFDHPQGKYHVIEFDDHAWEGSMVVFDAKKGEKATKALMKEQGIPSDRSDDLKAGGAKMEAKTPSAKKEKAAKADPPTSAQPTVPNEEPTATPAQVEIKL